MTKIHWHRRTKDQSEQQELKLRAILDVAAHKFSTQGYQKTSLDDLAAVLNVSKPALYYYFASKEDILFRCSETSLELVAEALGKAREASSTGIEQLRQFSRIYARLVAGDYGAALLREAHRNLKGQNRKRSRDSLGKGQRMLEEIVAQGIADGSIRDCSPKFLAYLLFSTFNHMDSWFDPAGRLSPEEIADRFLDIVVDGIGSHTTSSREQTG